MIWGPSLSLPPHQNCISPASFSYSSHAVSTDEETKGLSEKSMKGTVPLLSPLIDRHDPRFGCDRKAWGWNGCARWALRITRSGSSDHSSSFRGLVEPGTRMQVQPCVFRTRDRNILLHTVGQQPHLRSISKKEKDSLENKRSFKLNHPSDPLKSSAPKLGKS